MDHAEDQYLQLITEILENGYIREGRNGRTQSTFGATLCFDIQVDGFPLFTTKRMFWRGIVEELLWFLRGETDACVLARMGVHIWDANTSRAFLDSMGLPYPTGEAGPIYGWQIRSFNSPFKIALPVVERCGVDQLRFVVEELHLRPSSRRAVMSLWNPQQIGEMCLPPCHTQYIFHRSPKGLCCMMTMRGADVCAGLPFNVASTALLTTILANAIGTVPHRLMISIADAHVYENHVQSARVQARRLPYTFPDVSINRPPPTPEATVGERVAWIETLTVDHIVIRNYLYHPAIPYAMVP